MSNASPHTISLGDMMVDMAQEMAVLESAWRPLYGSSFAGSRPYPGQCVHIALPNASILVDAGDYAQAISLDSSYLPPAYVPPPGIVEQLLLNRGVRPLALAMGIQAAPPAGGESASQGSQAPSLDMCSPMEYPLSSSLHTDNRILFGRSRVNRSPG